MNKYYIVLVVSLLCMYNPIVFSASSINGYPKVGILSKNEIDHIKIASELTVSKDWNIVTGKAHVTCKDYSESIGFAELKEVIVFEDNDLSYMTPEKNTHYGKNSLFFKSCNSIRVYYSPLFNWGQDKNEYLDWNKTDAYIDTEYSLLLIDFGDSEELTDESSVKALFINKKHQLFSNKKVDESIYNWFLKKLRREPAI